MMRRRPFLQLLGLAGIAATVNPVNGLIQELPPGERRRPELQPDDALLDSPKEGLWCRLGKIELSPWITGISIVAGYQDVVVGDDTLPLLPIKYEAELDLMLPNQQVRYLIHEMFLAGFLTGCEQVLEFGDSHREYSIRVPTRIKFTQVDTTTAEIVSMRVGLFVLGKPVRA